MGAGDDDQLAGCGLNPEVERTPEGEFVGTDSNCPRAEAFSNGNSLIGRARVNQDDFHIYESLVTDSLQQTPNVFFFVICADDNGTIHRLYRYFLQQAVRRKFLRGLEKLPHRQRGLFGNIQQRRFAIHME